MKKAEEWLKLMLESPDEPKTAEEHDKLSIALYKKIQLDAWKAGVEHSIRVLTTLETPPGILNDLRNKHVELLQTAHKFAKLTEQ